MHIIPVLDLKQELVVHAKLGNRDSYRPIESVLCRSADIIQVIDSFLKLYPFSIFYIADLDAITHQGNNGSLIDSVLKHFPDTMFWIDSGYPLYDHRFRQYGNYLPVLGSESFQDRQVAEIKKLNHRFILSLDYSATGEMGAKSLFSEENLWPERIIVMSLPRVGSNLGPDNGLLTAYRKKHPDRQIIAAGGVRSSEDLKALDRIGINHALIASALHNGMLSAEEISHLQAKKYPA